MDVRKILEDNDLSNVIILDGYDPAFVVVTHDGRAVYDYDTMVAWLRDTHDFTEEEAIEWIEYNTIRALPYMGGGAPIILLRLGEEE